MLIASDKIIQYSQVTEISATIPTEACEPTLQPTMAFQFGHSLSVGGIQAKAQIKEIDNPRNILV